jgi:biopolymer transport protein ExbD/biopolymer transport protein TolR
MRRKHKPLIAEMNLTNLIDVTFALLIIFMITAPLLTQGVKVELPKLNAASIETINTISIHILKDRTVYIENDSQKQRVPLARFKEDFKEVYASSPEKAVVVNADKQIPYGIVMQIIGALKSTGVEKLGFLTDPAESEDAIQSLKL